MQVVRVTKTYMRNFKNVPKSKQKELISLFPDIFKLYAVENTDTYIKGSICVFDHWLSQDEAIKEIDKLSIIKEQEHNKNLHSFCTSLAKSTECYLIKLLGKKKKITAFKAFTNETTLEQTLIPKHHYVSDTHRFVLAFPELNLIYFEGCDFTHHLNYKSEENIQFIYKLASDNGLYLLK